MSFKIPFILMLMLSCSVIAADIFPFDFGKSYEDDPDHGTIGDLENRWFFGLNYSEITFENDAYLDGIGAHLGYVIHDFGNGKSNLYASISWQIGGTFVLDEADFENDLGAVIGQINMEHLFEPVLRVDVILLKRLRIYGLGGGAFSRYRDTENFGWKQDQTYVVGGGFEVRFAKNVGIFAEFREYDFEDDIEQTAIGLMFRF